MLLGIDIAAKMRRRAEMGYGLEDVSSALITGIDRVSLTRHVSL